jgi:hypothetical protein
MNAFDQALLRVAARQHGRAIPIRRSSSLCVDPHTTIGIATIKIVTEEQVQAIAFGRIGSAPEILIRLDPISRDVSDLHPFAVFLAAVADDAQREGGALRIWVPHVGTLEALDVLGHRYWRNQSAPDAIRRMGEICRIVAHEYGFPGQQTVADVAALLREHVITGLTPIEEGHLNAILAWLDPAVGQPLEESRERIRIPASGVLPNTPDLPLDDRVDRLRREAKGVPGNQRAALQREIATILSRAVLREWQLMEEARNAFLRLGLPARGLGDLVAASCKRILKGFKDGHFPARSPERLAIQLGQMEVGQQRADQASVENDPVLRAQAGNAGAVVLGHISNVDQPQRGRKPCHIEVDSDQRVIRFRRDDKVKILNTNVRGVVRGINVAPGGGVRVVLEITNGVRSSNVLAVGTPVELLEESFGFVNSKALNTARDRQPWPFYSDAMPSIDVLPQPSGSLLAIARGSRRP